MISGPRGGPPPAIVIATLCDCCWSFHATSAPAVKALARTAVQSSGHRYRCRLDRIAALPRDAGMPDPYRGESKRSTGVNRPGGYPHDKPCKLLVFERCQTPIQRGSGLSRVEHAWCKRHQGTED